MCIRDSTHTHTHTCTHLHAHSHTLAYNSLSLSLTLSLTHSLTYSEDDSSPMSSGSRGLPPLPNTDHYNLIRQRLDRYRRGSEGNFHSPTEIILRVPPRLPNNIATRMERPTHSRSRALMQERCSAARSRSISPGGDSGRQRSSSLSVDEVPLSVSQMYNPDGMDSGSST